MANDTRGNRQFNWLRQVAYRRDLLRQCSGVASALTKYFNSEEDEKTTLGRYLAYKFNIALIETELFLIERQGIPVYRNNEINRIIEKRLARPRPVIVEGVVVLRLLSELNRSPDFTIYVTNKNAPEIQGDFSRDLQAYEAQFLPRKLANLTIAFHGD